MGVSILCLYKEIKSDNYTRRIESPTKSRVITTLIFSSNNCSRGSVATRLVPYNYHSFRLQIYNIFLI